MSFSQNDCVDAIIVCGNSNFQGLTATGIGIQELNNSNSCTSQENNSLWLEITIETNGTLEFIIDPTNQNIQTDFDFFIFGPNASCGNIGHAIRCSTTNPQEAGLSYVSTGLNHTETDISEGPGSDGNGYVKWLDVLAGERYFIVIDRPMGTGDFALTWTGTATFSAPPVINQPENGDTLDLFQCDSDNLLDNSTQFDLAPIATTTIGSQNNVLATFHTSMNDAFTNINAIPNPTSFTNNSNPQTIYLRLTNTNNGCYSTTEFSLNVTSFLTNEPNDLKECDLNSDGFETFNLSNNNIVLTGNDSNLVVTYHLTQNSITTLPNNYTNQIAYTNETVWAKIADSSTGCYTFKPFELILVNKPNVTPAQLAQCDFQIDPDGLATFNLSQANNTLTNNNPNYFVTFHTSIAEAELNTGLINTIYSNIQNPQTLGVRVTDNTTGCYALTTLTLNVSLNPTMNATLRRCDDDGTEDGLTEFNLTAAGFETGTNTVTYYANSSDALLGSNSINSIFTNVQQNYQQVYARVENGNDCIRINTIDLFVDSLPNIEITDESIFCSNNSSNPILIDSGLGTQNPNDFTYSWTPNGETTSSISVFTEGTYTVSVTNNNNCSKLRTIIVKESGLAVVESISINDLTNSNTVIVYVEGNETDYLYSLDLPNGPFQESNYFYDVNPGIHNIFISDKDGCGTIKYEISVLGIPNFFTPNGDGINDNWTIIGMEKGFYNKATITIFDRYGKLLKQLAPADGGWNGMYNGHLMPSADYWYVIQLEDGRIVKGHMSLKR